MENSSDQAHGHTDEYMEDRTYKVTCQLCDKTTEIDSPLPVESFMHYICDSCTYMIDAGAILWECPTCDTYGFEPGENEESLVRHLVDRDGRIYVSTVQPVIYDECPVCRAEQVMHKLAAGGKASKDDLQTLEDALWNPNFWDVTEARKRKHRFEIRISRKNREDPVTILFSSSDPINIFHRVRLYSQRWY